MAGHHLIVSLFLLLSVPSVIESAYSANHAENINGTQQSAAVNTTGHTFSPYASARDRPPNIPTCAPQHTVDEGETLNSIWKRCCPREFRDSGYSWRTLCDENMDIQARHVECSTIKPGDKIKLPSQCNANWTDFKPEWEPTAKQARSSGLCAENITVQQNDTLFKIASQCCNLQDTVPEAEFSNFWSLTQRICEYNSNNRQAYDNLTLTERDPECAALQPNTHRAEADTIMLPPQCVKSTWGVEESKPREAACLAPPGTHIVDKGFKPCDAKKEMDEEWQRELLCGCDVQMLATCLSIPDGMPDFSIMIEPNSVAMGSQVVTMGNVSAQQSFTYEFASGSTTEIKMEKASKLSSNFNLNLGDAKSGVGASVGISGEVSLTNSTTCGTREDNKVTNTNTFHFPAGQCWGVVGFARARTMQPFQFHVMAEVHVKAKVNGTVCPPVHTLWAHGLDINTPVYSSRDCDSPDSKVYIQLKGTAERKLMMQSLMIAYRCDREVKIARSFQSTGFCTTCLKLAARKDGPAIERFSTAPLLSPQTCTAAQNASQTGNIPSFTESRCRTSAAHKAVGPTVLLVAWLWLLTAML